MSPYLLLLLSLSTLNYPPTRRLIPLSPSTGLPLVSRLEFGIRKSGAAAGTSVRVSLGGLMPSKYISSCADMGTADYAFGTIPSGLSGGVSTEVIVR